MSPETAAFEQALAFHCAPTLTALTCANLISLSQTDYPGLKDLLRDYSPRLEEAGILLFPLCRYRRRSLLLVCRPALLEDQLALPQVREFLADMGYPMAAGLFPVLEHLRRQVEYSGGFPHEIGFFLGYPPADVLGFLTLGSRNCKLCGYWKVYSDVEYARRCFQRFDRSRARLLHEVRQGRSLPELLAPLSRRAA